MINTVPRAKLSVCTFFHTNKNFLLEKSWCNFAKEVLLCAKSGATKKERLVRVSKEDSMYSVILWCNKLICADASLCNSEQEKLLRELVWKTKMLLGSVHILHIDSDFGAMEIDCIMTFRPRIRVET